MGERRKYSPVPRPAAAPSESPAAAATIEAGAAAAAALDALATTTAAATAATTTNGKARVTASRSHHIGRWVWFQINGLHVAVGLGDYRFLLIVAMCYRDNRVCFHTRRARDQL